MTKKRLRLIHKCWLTGLAIFLFLTSSNIIVIGSIFKYTSEQQQRDYFSSTLFKCCE